MSDLPQTPDGDVHLPPIPPKRYFAIGEVSELCAVKPHVLRYWEQEFSQLSPVKRRGNRRYYQHHEVILVRKIRDLLYRQGFTINGARAMLERGHDEHYSPELHGWRGDGPAAAHDGSTFAPSYDFPLQPHAVPPSPEMRPTVSTQAALAEGSEALPSLGDEVNWLMQVRSELLAIRDYLAAPSAR